MQPAATHTQRQGQHVRPDGKLNGSSAQVDLEALMEDSMPSEIWNALRTTPRESPVIAAEPPIALPDGEPKAAEPPIALPDAARQPASVLCEPDDEELDVHDDYDEEGGESEYLGERARYQPYNQVITIVISPVTKI